MEATVIVEVVEAVGNGGGEGDLDGEERGEGNLWEVWQYGEENFVEPVEPAGDLGEVWQYGEENLVDRGGVELAVAVGE